MKFIHYLLKDTKLIFSLFKTHSVVLGIIIVSYFASYGMNLFLSHLLKPSDYGTVSVVFQLLVFFAPFALVGTELSILRYIPKYLQEGKYDYAAGFIRWAFQTFCRTSLAILLLGSTLLTVSFILGDFHVKAIEKYSLIFDSFWIVPLFAFVTLQTSFLQALKRYFLSASFGGFTLTIAIVLVTMALIAFFDNTWIGNYQKRFSLILCIGIACLIVIVAQSFMIRRHLPKELFQATPRYQQKVWLKTSYQMMSSTIVFASLSAIDIMMLSFLGKDQAQVGHFAAIFVIASSIVVFSAAVDMIVNPLISPSIEQGNKSHLQSILNILSVFKVIPTVILGVVIVIFGSDLLEHFGKGFSDAYGPLLVMLLGFIVGQLLNSSGPILLYSGYQALSFKISIIQLSSIILLDCIFIPLFQLKGAVWVLSLSIIASSLARTYYSHKRVGILPFSLKRY